MEVFFGRTDGRTADKKRRKNFVLGRPIKYNVETRFEVKTGCIINPNKFFFEKEKQPKLDRNSKNVRSLNIKECIVPLIACFRPDFKKGVIEPVFGYKIL